MTTEDVAVKNIRLVHHAARKPWGPGEVCNQDGNPWPCDARILLDEIDRLHRINQITAAPVVGEPALDSWSGNW